MHLLWLWLPESVVSVRWCRTTISLGAPLLSCKRTHISCLCLRVRAFRGRGWFFVVQAAEHRSRAFALLPTPPPPLRYGSIVWQFWQTPPNNVGPVWLCDIRQSIVMYLTNETLVFGTLKFALARRYDAFSVEYIAYNVALVFVRLLF